MFSTNTPLMNYSHYSEEDFILDESFIDWFKGGDAANAAFWEAWVAAHPEKREIVDNARRFLASLHLSDTIFTDEDMHEEWSKIQAMLYSSTGQVALHGNSDYREVNNAASEPKVVAMPVANRWLNWPRMAVAVAVFLLVGTAVFYQSMGDNKLAYSTKYGETQKITLPDGSIVILNAKSTLAFHEDWSDQTAREVWLEGEAFFNVVKKPGSGAAKFYVHTHALNVEVLGTEFNIRERRGGTAVVLNSGRIKISSDLLEASDSLIMKPGEMVQVLANKNSLLKRQVNPELYSSWRNLSLIHI